MMTDTDIKEREKIVKSMKKNFKDFRKRYGKRAKDVMYATATKMAMKEETSEEKGEYDYEGDMAKSSLKTIIRNAQTMHDMLSEDTNLPEWVQSKITLAEDYIVSATQYMQSEMNEGVTLDETSKAKASAYLKKATEKLGQHSQQLAKHKASGNYWLASASQQMINKRSKGISRAIERLQKEEKDETPKVKYKKMRSQERLDARTKDVDQNYAFRSDN
jgi:hypothetical protein